MEQDRNSKPNLEELEILYKEGIDKEAKYTIKNIYLFGSRLYQCYNEESDWDFIFGHPFLKIALYSIYFGKLKCLMVSITRDQSCMRKEM